MTLQIHLSAPNSLAFTRQTLKFKQAAGNSVPLDGSNHFGIACTAVVRPSDFPPSGGMDDESSDLVVVAVDPSFRVNERVSTSNHVNQRPKPWRPVFVVAMQAVDDGTSLDVHRIYGDFIGLFSHRSNPLDAVVQGIGFVHEGRFEHQIGLDSKVEFLEIGHGTVPR